MTAAKTSLVKAYDEAGAELFCLPGSMAPGASARAVANQKAINAQRAVFPTMYRVEVINTAGVVVDDLLMGKGRNLNPAVWEDGHLVLMFR